MNTFYRFVFYPIDGFIWTVFGNLVYFLLHCRCSFLWGFFVFSFFFFFFFYCILGFGVHVKNMHRYIHGNAVFCLHPHHLYLAFLPRLSLPSSPHHCPSPISPNRPQCLVLPSLCPCVLIFHHPPMSENMHCFIFCSWVSLLRMMFSRFIHVPTNDTNSSFLIAA